MLQNVRTLHNTHMMLSFLPSWHYPMHRRSVTHRRSAASGVALPVQKGERLAELYRPPLDLLFHGTFDQAKQEAEAKGKLLLVNIQTPTEFNCQLLNRDTWRNEKVRQLVKERFVLWQQEQVRGAHRIAVTFD